MNKKRIATTIETKRLVIIRSGGQKMTRAWCGSCCAPRHLLTVEYAAFLSGLSQRQLFREVENGRLHFAEIVGMPLLCLDSLCDTMPQTKELISKLME